jgi:protein-disulfide isomerase
LETKRSVDQSARLEDVFMFQKLGMTGLVILLASTVSIPAFSSDQGQMIGGSMSSPVRIEVFSDFQCPACRDLYLGAIRQVLQDYSSKDKVCVIYHEFPLSIHAYGKEAARYSEAASRMGIQNLLTVFDSLFADQAQWSQDGDLDAVIAKALPQDEYRKLKKVIQDPSINQSIEKEVQLGLKKDIKSTPTMFIYYAGKEQKVEGAISYTTMKQFLDTVIK